MRNRLLSAIAIFSLTLVSGAASASVLTVSTYSMNNGDGTGERGSFDYLDHIYLPNLGNAATTPKAPLSGGTGLLTNGVAPTVDWATVPLQYVGWKYFDPTIVFNLAGLPKVGELDLYMSGNTGGLVGLPAIITVNGNPVSFTTTSIGFAVDKLSILFGGGITGSTFAVQLFAGPELADAIAISVAQDPFIIDPRTGNHTLVEPWIMLSEAQFLSAVPEPATWAMMLIGFAALAFVSYRRTRKITARLAA
jgi:PEP-CTERM motif